MLLTIETGEQAGDFGYLFGKHPQRVQSFTLPWGRALVFYPQVSTVALLLELDPVLLSRGRGAKRSEIALEPYVNDRPYVASSFLCVALARVFAAALKGTCRQRPALVETALPLTARLPTLPCRGGPVLLKRLFQPLGYTLEAERLPLDERFPSWGESSVYSVTLSGRVTVQTLLRHLYVLLPVLDDRKHYWVGDDELDNLLGKGAGWLADHPERELIAHRALKRQRGLSRVALERLERAGPEGEGSEVEGRRTGSKEETEEKLERPIALNTLRMDAVVETLAAARASRVLDLGCGEGTLLRRLLKDPRFERVVGVDVAPRSLERAQQRLERLPERVRARGGLWTGSAVYRDARFADFDAICLIEVIEHVDASRLPALAQVVFGAARPRTVLVTTPNRSYNARFSMKPGALRHRDHRWEWDRAEFRSWAEAVAERFGYRVRISGIGEEDEALGAPTQMGTFTRCDGTEEEAE